MKHLGQKSQYSKVYNPSLLERDPRVVNRSKYGIEEDSLPFIGYDIWHMYELSFLQTNGCPWSGVGKLVYPCSSKYIVESKSLKLYLNSFNYEILTLEDFILTVTSDLSKLLEVEVEFDVFTDRVHLQEGYSNLMFPLYKPSSLILFDLFEEDPSLLDEVDEGVGLVSFRSNLLKSNCRVTSQPDWGDIYIYMTGERLPTKDALLRYIVSFRDENHFHEEVVEMIYKRLWDRGVKELMVGAIYTRRGGIDICPCRVSDINLYTYLGLRNIIQSDILTSKTLRQ